LASSEHNSPTTASPGYPHHTGKSRFRLKSHLMVIIQELKRTINNFHKEIQENTGKQVEAFKEKSQKSLKELQETTTKQVKELNKTMQELKMEIETIVRSQRKTTLEIENLGKG
jgi:CRISPR/Cas system type I-B associated protein Csh2 (Cas7 group RAMP superfamily)